MASDVAEDDELPEEELADDELSEDDMELKDDADEWLNPPEQLGFANPLEQDAPPAGSAAWTAAAIRAERCAIPPPHPLAALEAAAEL